jgi:hypothetical protein
VAVAAGIVVAIAGVAAGTIALGGSNDDSTSTPAAAVTGTPADATATAAVGEFGPAPELGGNVLEVIPAHGARVSQQSTRSPDPQRPGGVCARVSFDGLPENAQWFRMQVDNTEVTSQLTWVVANADSPEGGRVCWAPATGLSAGRHTVGIRVSDPKNPAAPAKQTVAWSFEVVP